jgi:hypothetical protein
VRGAAARRRVDLARPRAGAPAVSLRSRASVRRRPTSRDRCRWRRRLSRRRAGRGDGDVRGLGPVLGEERHDRDSRRLLGDADSSRLDRRFAPCGRRGGSADRFDRAKRRGGGRPALRPSGTAPDCAGPGIPGSALAAPGSPRRVGAPACAAGRARSCPDDGARRGCGAWSCTRAAGGGRRAGSGRRDRARPRGRCGACVAGCAGRRLCSGALAAAGRALGGGCRDPEGRRSPSRGNRRGDVRARCGTPLLRRRAGRGPRPARCPRTSSLHRPSRARRGCARARGTRAPSGAAPPGVPPSGLGPSADPADTAPSSEESLRPARVGARVRAPTRPSARLHTTDAGPGRFRGARLRFDRHPAFR